MRQKPKKPERQRKASKGMTVEQYLTRIVSLMRRSAKANRVIRPKKRPYVCIEDFLLQNGRAFIAKPLPEGIRKGRKNECYRNALMLMLDNAGLTYVEGYASANESLPPTHHAWCVDGKGNVIDPTWPEGANYFGVPFRREFVQETTLATGRAGVIRNWEQKFPLLTAKVKGYREEKFFR